MSELLEKAVEAVRQLPSAEQDSIASAILSMAQLYKSHPATIDPDELREVLKAQAEVDRGEIATLEEVVAAWRTFER